MSETQTFEHWAGECLRVIATPLQSPMIDDDTLTIFAALNQIIFLTLPLLQKNQTDVIINQLEVSCKEFGERMQSIFEEMTQPRIVFEPGGTIYIPPNKRQRRRSLPFMHWCAACLDFFRSRTEYPNYCGKCKSTLWQSIVKDARRVIDKHANGTVSDRDAIA